MRMRDLFENYHIELTPLTDGHWTVGIVRDMDIERGARQVVASIAEALEIAREIGEMMVDETEVRPSPEEIARARRQLAAFIGHETLDEPWPMPGDAGPEGLRAWFERQMEREEL